MEDVSQWSSERRDNSSDNSSDGATTRAGGRNRREVRGRGVEDWAWEEQDNGGDKVDKPKETASAETEEKFEENTLVDSFNKVMLLDDSA